jgi:serine/threonine protein kinase/signal recognition particle receptor subunit beta
VAHIDFARRRLTCKLVYCGPGLSGKTTNLEAIHANAPAERRGQLCSIATQSDRTLFFDYMPLEVGRPGGLSARLMIYTVPGQAYYASTRTLVLQGADGIVFVADSRPESQDDNVAALEELRRNLTAVGLCLDDLPLVFQWNKQDVPGAVAPDELARRLGARAAPAFSAVALRGEGVRETLKEIARLVLDRCEADLRRPCPAALDEPPPAPQPPPGAAAPDDPRARLTRLDTPEPEPAPEPASAPPLPWRSSSHGDPAPASSDPVIGQSVGGCVIHSKLGEGGMGAIYVARHALLGKDVVVKVLKPHLALQVKRVERFFLEARAAAKLDHPNVVRVQDLGTNERGLHYIVMEYVEGTNLDQRIRERGAHDPVDATRLVLEVARALVALHQADLVHRDIKAENVVVTPAGDVKLIDFGLVKDKNANLNLTRQGALIGTPAYIAPEVGREPNVDGRADIYSLGLTYYYLLAGRPPFEGCEVHDVIFGRARLRAPEALNPAVRAQHRRVLARMLKRRRDDRYPDALSLCRDLEALLAGASVDAVGAEGEDVFAARTPVTGNARGKSSSARHKALAPSPPVRLPAPAATPPAARPAAASSPPPEAPRTPAPPEVAAAFADATRRLGRYVLLEVVDAAGAGVLHRAWDLTRRAPVLLRTVDGVKRLERAGDDALTLARRLRHPALAPALDHGVSDGRLFVVTELAPDEGRPPATLESLEGKLTAAEVARIVHDVAGALAHAHEQGLVHGALTPASVLVDAKGRGLLLDLGLAQAEAPSAAGRARLAARLHRAGCLAPEALADEGAEPTPAGDLYALGAVLRRALGGGATPLSPDLAAIRGRCLDPQPRGRYATAADLARALDRYLVGGVESRPPAPRALQAPRAVVAGALALAVLVGAVVGSAWRQAALMEERAVRLEGLLGERSKAEAERE